MDCDPEMVAEGVLGGPRPALGGQGVVNGEGEGVSVLHVEPPGFCLRRNPGCTLVRQGEKERGTGGQLEAEGVFEHLLLVWSSRPSRWGPWDRTPSRPGAPAPPAPPPPPQARLPPTLVRVPVQFLLLFPCELSPAALEWSPSPLSAFAGSLPPARHGLLLSRLLRRSLTAGCLTRSAQIPLPSLYIWQRSFHSRFKTHCPGDPGRQMHRHPSAQQLLLSSPVVSVW